MRTRLRGFTGPQVAAVFAAMTAAFIGLLFISVIAAVVFFFAALLLICWVD